MSVYHVCIMLSLLALSRPTVASGQTQAGDSTVPAPGDSSSAQNDSAGSRVSSGDSASADTTRSAADSSQPAKQEKPAGAPVKPTVVATPVPADSILIGACSSSGGPTRTAPDLLVVIFTPEAGKADRAAAARSVKGKLLGQVVSEPGAYYLSVPTGGQEYQLRAAADRLVLSPVVRQVGSRACPPLPPADTSGPKAKPNP